VVPGVVRGGAPAAAGRAGAAQGVVAKGLAHGALCELVEAQVAFDPEGGGKSREARQGR
jgi:hypothetical protein